MENSHILGRPSRLAGVGVVLILPALLLTVSGLLELSAPDLLVHPVLVMGGLMLAVVLNVLPVLTARIDNGNLVDVIRVQGRLLNLSMLGLGLLLLATILVYGFVENFRVVAR